MSKFQPAKRTQSRLRLALTGPSGSGKTYSALLIAKGLGGRVAVIDTEHGSASLYSDVTPFDVLTLEAPFSPDRYIEAIHDAEQAGYDVLVIDSITHEWNGKGGILEIHDRVTRSSAKGNSYTAWADVTPRHNAFIEAILQSKLHVIVTMRSKQDFTLVDKGGRSVPQKIGLAPIQRDGMEYEFTVVLDIGVDGNMAMASKDRTRLFTGRSPERLSAADGERLRAWLQSGEPMAPQPAPGPVEEQPEQRQPEQRQPAETVDAPKYVDDAIHLLGTTTDMSEIVSLRDQTKQVCAKVGAADDYKRFVDAMKSRVAALSAQKEAA